VSLNVTSCSVSGPFLPTEHSATYPDIVSTRPWLSLIVVAYNIPRELPRTLLSLSTAYQRGLPSEDFEIIVVDNGSIPPIRAADVEAFGTQFRLVTNEAATVSPVAAVNRAMHAARGQLVGAIFDGARMSSPGSLRGLHDGSQMSDRPFVTLLSWHLGPDHQSRSILAGYDARQEDELLASISWPENGYELFHTSSLEASNPSGWFGVVAESTCFVTTHEVLSDVGYLDERFRSAGGGLVNHHFLKKVVDQDDVDLVVVLGEGTFHQVHGGISTNSPIDRWTEFAAEYASITGSQYHVPRIDPIYVGRVSPEALQWIGSAAEVARLTDAVDAMGAHASALAQQNTELRALADGFDARMIQMNTVLSDVVERSQALSWPGVSGADVLAGTDGFIDGRLVRTHATLCFVALREAPGLTIEGWSPPSVDGRRALEVRVHDDVYDYVLDAGLFSVFVPCDLSPQDEMMLHLLSHWSVPAAVPSGEPQTAYSWRFVGAALGSSIVETPQR